MTKTLGIFIDGEWVKLGNGGGSGGSGPRMVWGSLYNDADIISGTGFTTATGGGLSLNQIKIIFDTAFTNPPVVLLTANNDNALSSVGRYVVSLIGTDIAYIIVQVEDVDDADRIDNGGFDFLCIEPGV